MTPSPTPVTRRPTPVAAPSITQTLDGDHNRKLGNSFVYATGMVFMAIGFALAVIIASFGLWVAGLFGLHLFGV